MIPRLDGLRLQLLGLVILPFSALLLVVALAGTHLHQEAMRHMLAERDVRAVTLAAGTVGERVQHRRELLAGFVQRMPVSAAALLAADPPSQFDAGLALLSPAGQVMSADPAAQAWVAEIPASFLGQAQGGGNALAILQGPDGGTVVLQAAASAGTVLVGGTRAATLLESAAPPVSSPDSPLTTFLVDGTGALIAASGTTPGVASLLDHPGVHEALQGQTGSSYAPAADGEHIVAYAPVPGTGWALVTEEPWENALSPLLNTTLLAPLVLVPALAVTTVALWFGARQVIAPLRRLEVQAGQLEHKAGFALDAPVGGIAEIQHLQASLASMARRIRAAQLTLRSYIAAITRAQEDERRRLARELHDQTIQDLIALDQRVQILAMDLRTRELPQAALADELHHEAQRTIEEVRRLTRALRPIYLEDLGLVPALEMLTRDLQADLGIPIAIRTTGAPRRLPAETELALYRIAQEALNNVGKHAQARRAWLELAFSEDGLSMAIGDDGVGFSPTDAAKDPASQGHFGLIGMRERADLIQAQLEIASKPGHGTQITVRLSVPSAPAV
ncbi:MAG: hypothetical protein A2Y93_00370 [Chloroflexi bacterium RBG_13_68_17]|nr:MAG: hypothetical protein A2Y93_00370 [Chloroflexi bacterium RBG_13_68_17]